MDKNFKNLVMLPRDALGGSCLNCDVFNMLGFDLKWLFFLCLFFNYVEKKITLIKR